MIHGVLPVYKPKGYTSHDIVSQIRRWSGQKRVGHTGTLDPAVEGVLPICLGQATRIVEYIQELPKRYRGSMVLGIATDTEDQTGEVIKKQEVPSIPDSEIKHVFQTFLGEIEQIPPMYSAVKVNGKRLYQLARQGDVVSRKPRKITIYELQYLSIQKGTFPILHFDVLCSKGTYIRTLCVDIGKALGFPAHLASLVRTESGPFQLPDCYHLAEVTKLSSETEQQRVLYTVDEVLGHLPSLIIQDSDVKFVQDGLPLQVADAFSLPTLVRIYSETGKFCALYRVENGIAKPEKVFRDVN